MNQPPYTRRTLKNLETPFQVYARQHQDEWYFPSGNRYRPVGKPIVVTEVYNADPHTVHGTSSDGKLVIFGGASGKHWIIEDPQVEAPEFEGNNIIHERPNAQGSNHYLNRMDPREKQLNIKIRSITRSITMANERLNHLGDEVKRTQKHIDQLAENLRQHREKLAAMEGEQQ